MKYFSTIIFNFYLEFFFWNNLCIKREFLFCFFRLIKNEWVNSCSNFPPIVYRINFIELYQIKKICSSFNEYFIINKWFDLLVFPHGHMRMPWRGQDPHSSLWHLRWQWWIWQFNKHSVIHATWNNLSIDCFERCECQYILFLNLFYF